MVCHQSTHTHTHTRCAPGLRILTAVLCCLASAEIPLNAQPCSSANPPCVLTAQYGNQRQSWNGNETVLTTSNVTNLTKYARLAVDNSSSALGTYNPIYAQPLYVAGITVNSSYQSNCNNLTVNSQPACNMLVAVTAYDSIWAWNADTGTVIFSRTGLWSDCGPTGSSVSLQSNGAAGSAHFAGILSTPVIDITLPIPGTSNPTLYGTMFLTSACKNSGSTVEWYLHEIDLTNNLRDVPSSNSPLQILGTSSAADYADDYDPPTQTVSFMAFEESQRPALLEVTNSYASPNPIIYVPFGSAVSEAYNTSGNPTQYHGWVFAYTVSGTNNQLSLVSGFPFSTTVTGASGNTDSPPCCQDCQYNQSNPLSPNCVPTTGVVENSPNWCGHGGGIFGSSRRPAANTIGTGSSQVAYSYFGVGNGGFQTNGQNWGQSILDFTLSQSGGAGATPYQSFTPHGGPQGCSPTGSTHCAPGLQAPLGSACPNETAGNCLYTSELTNENDWDMSTSGILLFDDLGGQHRLVTCDKAAYCHVLQQGQLCGYSGCTGQEFTAGDTGDWPFGALAANECDALAISSDSCHRVSSLALYNNTLYYWPYGEDLSSLVLSDPGTQTAGGGNLTTSTAGSIVSANGSACSTGYSCPCTGHGGACFTSKVTPGDYLIVGGCSPTGGTCPVITSVQSDTLLYLSFDPGVTMPSGWHYSGYFIKPEYDTRPSSGAVGFPGGSVVVTSNATNSGTGIVWGLISVPTACYSSGAGALNAYDASSLSYLCSSNSLTNPPLFSNTYPAFNATAGMSAGLYALPTIANGNVYVPTFGVNSGTCASPTAASGVIVFCGNSNVTYCTTN